MKETLKENELAGKTIAEVIRAGNYGVEARLTLIFTDGTYAHMEASQHWEDFILAFESLNLRDLDEEDYGPLLEHGVITQAEIDELADKRRREAEAVRNADIERERRTYLALKKKFGDS